MIAAPRPVDLDIPASHADLFVRRVCGVLTTLRADGQPRSSLVWIDLDDGSAVINTALGRQKARNLQADRRCSLLVVDPDDTSRFIQIRGEAELSTDGALDHLERLTHRYTGHRHYYGRIYPVERASRETRVIVRIRARRITLDAIHA